MKTILKQKENRSFQANSNALNDMNFANTEMKNMEKAKEQPSTRTNNPHSKVVMTLLFNDFRNAFVPWSNYKETSEKKYYILHQKFYYPCAQSSGVYKVQDYTEIEFVITLPSYSASYSYHEAYSSHSNYYSNLVLCFLIMISGVRN